MAYNHRPTASGMLLAAVLVFSSITAHAETVTKANVIYITDDTSSTLVDAANEYLTANHTLFLKCAYVLDVPVLRVAAIDSVAAAPMIASIEGSAVKRTRADARGPPVYESR